VSGLVAVRAVLLEVARPDPAGVPTGRFLPAAGGPSPLILLPVPVAADPHITPAGPDAPSLPSGRRRRIRGDADADGPQVHADPDLGGCGHAAAQHEQRGYDKYSWLRLHEVSLTTCR